MLDLSIVEIQTQAALNKSTQFKISSYYLGSGEAPSLIQLYLSKDSGSTYTLLNSDYFEIDRGSRGFHLKVAISETSKISSDNKIVLLLRPISNVSEFINASDDLKIEIPYQLKERDSILTLTNQSTVVENDKVCTIAFDITPQLSFDTRVHIDSSSDSVTTITEQAYSFDGLSWQDLPLDGIIDPQIASDKLYYRCKAKTTHPSLGKFKLSLAEVGITKRIENLPLHIDFSVSSSGHLPKDTLIRLYCSATSKVADYADGSGGTYTKVLELKSKECGYIPPPIGTVLKTYCANFNQYRQVADGNDGYIVELVNENDRQTCGYTAPIAKSNADFTPAQLVGFGTNIVSNSSLGLASRKRDGANADYAAMHSKWYWEIRIDKAEPEHFPMAFGIATLAFNRNNWIGSDSQSWGIWAFNNTKHHNDVQSEFNLPVTKGDIVSLLLDTDRRELKLWLNGNDKGVVFNDLPEFTKFYPIFNAEKDSYILVNFGQYTFQYTPPAGYIAGFGKLVDEPKERGIEIKRYCDGTQKVAEYHDGRRGKYTRVLADSDPDCGYNPPKGYFLGFICEGVNQYKKLADGQGGFTKELHRANSRDCGYVPPKVTPTKLISYPEDTQAQYQSRLNSDRVSGLVYEPAIAEYGIYSGKWYWEYTVESVDTSVGLMTAQIARTLDLTDASKSHHQVKNLALLAKETSAKEHVWCMDLSTRRLMHNGRFEYYGYEILPGDVIGFNIDFKEQTLKISINGSYKPDLIFKNLPSEYTYLAAVSTASSIANNFKFNFGQEDFKYEPDDPDSVLGIGETTPIHPRKGSETGSWCEQYTLYRNIADGIGGFTKEKVEDNSRVCGYVPPTPRGTLESKVCRGYDQYGRYHDGNYSFYEELIQEKSTECGYYPKDALVSSHCTGFDKIGVYSNGDVPQTTYEKVIEKNSLECGYVKTNDYPRPDRSRIDPNLPLTIPNGLHVKIHPIPASTTALHISKKL